MSSDSENTIKTKKTKKRKINREGLTLTLMALPFLVLVFLFSYLPLFGWSFAFFDYRPGMRITDMPFVGLKYFEIMITFSTEVLRALRNTIVMSLMSLSTSFFPIIFAIALNELRGSKTKRLIQTAVTLPHFISWVIVFSLCFAIFSHNGMYNNFIRSLGIDAPPNTVLTSARHTWLFMTILDVWKGLGWTAIIYLAAIAGIDTELYEAASVDGAGRWRCIRHITVPGLMPTYVVLLLLQVGSLLSIGLERFLVFRNPLNSRMIENLDLYIFRIGIMTADYSFATAIGILRSFVSLILLFSVNALAKKIRGESII